jgi:hypothetical protein
LETVQKVFKDAFTSNGVNGDKARCGENAATSGEMKHLTAAAVDHDQDELKNSGQKKKKKSTRPPRYKEREKAH